MKEEALKTSKKQRIIIGFIAFLMLFSTIAVYAMIVLGRNGEGGSGDASVSALKAKLDDLEKKLYEKENSFSSQYLEQFKGYRSRVKSYNATNINNGGIVTNDIVEGNGKTITKSETYMAYYIGWCANEEVFDSSFDDFENPTHVSPLTHTPDSVFVTGWEEGVEGMKAGGVREIAMPGELAYGETREICGGTNSPLKFVVMAVEEDSEYTAMVNEYNSVYTQYIDAYYSSSASKIDSATSGDE